MTKGAGSPLKGLVLFKTIPAMITPMISHRIHRGGDPGAVGKEGSHQEGKTGSLAPHGIKGVSMIVTPSIPLVLNCAGGGNSRHGTPCPNQHRNKRFTTQAKLPKYAVHDEGNACHIAAIFHKGEEEEEDHHLGDKG